MLNAKYYLDRAQSEHFAIGAFNAANIETLKAIIGAAKTTNAPVIIEASHGEIEFIGGQNFVDIIRNARQEYNLPIFTNLDHAPNVETTLQGIKWGFDLIHFNGSSLPYTENVSKTQEVVLMAHQQDRLVEAELDAITGSSSLHTLTAEEQLATAKLTDPLQAADFVTATGIDTLAASFGSVHGLYATPKNLDIDRLKEIHTKTSCYLSLHGGSDMPEDQIKQAIENGVVKINVNSELRLAFRTTLEKTLKENSELAIYKIMPPVIAAVQRIVEDKINLFGCTDKA